MKQPKINLKREYETALAYYKSTVWNHACGVQLPALQYDVALRAWNRLHNAHDFWFRSLNSDEQSKLSATDSEIEELRPLRLERDDSIKPELLANVASARLGIRKPKSIRNAVEEAHQILMASRAYLKELPATKEKLKADFDAYFISTVPFGDILATSGLPDCIPLLPPSQANRNNGKIKPRALEQALKRHANGAPEKIQQEIRQALKNKAISCRLLEEIRWQRFRRRFKGR